MMQEKKGLWVDDERWIYFLVLVKSQFYERSEFGYVVFPPFCYFNTKSLIVHIKLSPFYHLVYVDTRILPG